MHSPMKTDLILERLPMQLRRAMMMITLSTLAVPAARANHYRIYFQGSEAVALQASGQPVPVAAVGPAPVAVPVPAAAVPAAPAVATIPVPAPPVGAPMAYANPNLAANCPTCVPGGNANAHHGAGVPNQIVTFLHPYTGKAVTVPLTLPVGRPSIVTRSDRIIYNYGLFGYKIVVKFLPTGLVEVRYND